MAEAWEAYPPSTVVRDTQSSGELVDWWGRGSKLGVWTETQGAVERPLHRTSHRPRRED